MLAAFLRGEVDSWVAKSKLEQLSGFKDDGTRAVNQEGDYALFWAAARVQQINLEISEDDWEDLRTELAFLLTDFEYPQLDDRQKEAESLRRTRCFAAIHLLALVSAGIAGYWLGWWIPIVAVPLSAILFWVPAFFFGGRREDVDPSFPFPSEAESITYKTMIEKFELPATFAESVFPSQRRLPPQYSLRERIEAWEEYAGCAAIVMGCVILWPILLVAMVVTPSNPVQRDSKVEPEG
ncbi:hypothetical protein [Blastopirellula marina]|uniref:hypothetical protein n=1 Tax=Blastopirellula marina TaxID=124 RepID=UPI0011B04122|nr:hypothetical protein [Blastopirellula marina]